MGQSTIALVLLGTTMVHSSSSWPDIKIRMPGTNHSNPVNMNFEVQPDEIDGAHRLVGSMAGNEDNKTYIFGQDSCDFTVEGHDKKHTDFQKIVDKFNQFKAWCDENEHLLPENWYRGARQKEMRLSQQHLPLLPVRRLLHALVLTLTSL